MARQRIDNYTFSASGKTVTFNSYANIEYDRILGIANAKVGRLIFDPTRPGYGGTVLTNVLTFDASNAGMSNGDGLVVYYDVYPTDSIYESQIVKVSGVVDVSGTVSTTPPVGGSTSALQESGSALLNSILTKLADPATQTTLAALLSKVNNGIHVSGEVQGLTPEWSIATETPVDVSGKTVDYIPGYHGSSNIKQRLAIDEGGAVAARAAVMTDEGSYRFNGSGSTFGTSIGTCTFTQNSNIVTGSGFLAIQFLHNYEYVSSQSGPQTSVNTTTWYKVIAYTDTQIELESPYLGTTTTTTGYSCPIASKQGTGATVSTANGIFSIQSGTTDSSISEFERDVDILPLIKECELSISQRIANQNIYVGFYDEVNNPSRFYARFDFNGINSNVVVCNTGFSRHAAPIGGEIESTIAYVPNSALYNRYRVEALADKVRYYINDTLVAEHRHVIMRPQDYLTSTIQIVNGTGAASSTTVSCDYDSCQNFNKISVGFTDKETVNTTAPTLDETLHRIAYLLDMIANPVTLELTSGRTRVVLDALGGAQTLGTVTTVGTVTTMSQIGAIPANSFIYDQMHMAWAQTIQGRIT